MNDMKMTLAMLAKMQVSSGVLDELVHELKISEAVSINNGGLEAQVMYLYDELGAVAHEAILRRVADEDEMGGQ